MRIASNKIIDVKRFFIGELKDIYPNEEITILFKYCLEEYLSGTTLENANDPKQTISESELLKFNFAVKALMQNKPIQYIFGRADFYGLKLKVNEHVLIPRQETEELVHLIINENKNNLVSILDIGTGSGCIPIVLKKKMPLAKVTALDISDKALEIAKENASLIDVEIEFMQQDILEGKDLFIGKKFNVIVSNPPYVRALEKSRMHKNVINYEPHLALFVEDRHPLKFYEAIADFALNHLETDGKLYFEINEFLGVETKQLLVDKGFKNCNITRDINGKNRILQATI